jgi:glycogen synthase
MVIIGCLAPNPRAQIPTKQPTRLGVDRVFGQNGFDVFASAIDAFLKKGGNARLILFPMPGDEGDKGLRFLQKLAVADPTRVLVLPFRFDAGYMAALQGADFGVMSSLYEPFGATNEMALLEHRSL